MTDTPMPVSEWPHVLAGVEGHRFSNEDRISTRELCARLGCEMDTKSLLEVRRVMQGLGWAGPRPVRVDGRKLARLSSHRQGQV
jgi:hypothetical protein